MLSNYLLMYDMKKLGSTGLYHYQEKMCLYFSMYHCFLFLSDSMYLNILKVLFLKSQLQLTLTHSYFFFSFWNMQGWPFPNLIFLLYWEILCKIIFYLSVFLFQCSVQSRCLIGVRRVKKEQKEKIHRSHTSSFIFFTF